VPTFQTVNSWSLTLNPSYNFFGNNFFGSNIFVPKGTLIRINLTTGTEIFVENTNMFSDCLLSTICTSINRSMLVQMSIAPIRQISLAKTYSVSGNFTVGVKVLNKLNASYSRFANTPLAVFESITNLRIVSATGRCVLNKPCDFNAETTSGSSILFNWNMSSNQIGPTPNRSVAYTFTTSGVFTIGLFAQNFISSQSASLSIRVTDLVEGLSLKSGNSVQSASVLGQNALFHFRLNRGIGYTCSLDFGDGTSVTFTDDPNLNDTNITHSYANIERVYKINLACSNELNSASIAFDHYVQTPLSGLSLISRGVETGIQYSLMFKWLAGSPINSIILFKNSLVAFDFSTPYIGKSSVYPGEQVNSLYPIYIKLENYVSMLELNETFEVSSSIQNPVLEIEPSFGLAAYKYEFPVTKILRFKITMLAGSNINVKIFTGTEKDPNVANIIELKSGPWLNTYLFQYDYPYPDTFLVKVELTNALSSALLTKTITLISRVNELVPDLVPNPVIYRLSNGGLAQFVLKCNQSKGGSHATVKYWPGDQSNATHGPFILGMDYELDMSKVSLSYQYNSVGNYIASFLVSNELGTKTFQLPFNVVAGLDGFYMDVKPTSAVPSTPIAISAYVIQGINVSFEWKINGTILRSAPKACNLFLLPIDYYLDVFFL
jgi:hypothetical protein